MRHNYQLIILLVLQCSFLGSAAFAENAKRPSEKATPKVTSVANQPQWQPLCDSVSKAAEVVMKGRQTGTSMSEMMKQSQLIEDKDLRDLTVTMVTSAFEKNRWSTNEMMVKEIQNFRDYYYMTCFKTYNK
jgi:hypothetical protein